MTRRSRESWQTVESQETCISVTSARQETCQIRFGSLEEGISNELAPGSVQQALVVAADDVPDRTVHRVMEAIRTLAFNVQLMQVSGLESAKSFRTVLGVWQRQAEMSFDRRSLLVGLGGGVLCDVVGFAAATYLRGVPYALVPTSLIAQVDAAVGGKVGVDFSQSKNRLGYFYNPDFVLVDHAMLEGLPPREIRAGLAEMLKVAMLAGHQLFVTVSRLELPAAWNLKDPSPIAKSTIRSCIEAKVRLLQSDPIELGSLDRSLNLGHAVGHALEAATHFLKYRHGEAVAVGLATEASISFERSYMGRDYYLSVLESLANWDLPLSVPCHLEDLALQNLDCVADVQDGTIRFVLPTEPGEWHFARDVTESELRQAWRKLRYWNRDIEMGSDAPRTERLGEAASELPRGS